MKCIRTIYVSIALQSCIYSAAICAPDKSGVKSSVISLPSGAGSIEGLGESFEPQLNTGSATYGIAIAIPPGRAGLQPSIRLSYNSNAGNSFVGLGWSLDFPSIRRQTDKGFPSYTLTDTFLFGSEELVPLSNPERDWRCENESGFQRFRHIDTDDDQIPDAWEMTDRDGTRHVFGSNRGAANQYSVVEHPDLSVDHVSSFDRTYCWALDKTEDLHGNRIEYEYFPPFNEPSSSGILFPKTIRYSFLKGNYHEIRFRYEGRDDVFDDYRPTFAVTTGKRLTRIEVYSHYDGVSHLVRAYDIEYDYRSEDFITIPPSALDLGVSLLKRFVQQDRSGDPENFLPPLLFEYSRLNLSDAELNTDDSHQLPEIADSDGNIQIADVNGDGLPDILETGNTAYQVSLNMGEIPDDNDKTLTFMEPVNARSFAPRQLETANVSLSDFDADGLVDIVGISSDGPTGAKKIDVFQNLSRLDRYDDEPAGFTDTAGSIHGAPATIAFDDPNIRQMDVNFDKISDFVSNRLDGPTGDVLFTFRYAGSDGAWMYSEWRIGSSFNLLFASGSGNDASSNPEVHLADMNGDRLLDLVHLGKTGTGPGATLTVRYWPYCALGRWGALREVERDTNDTFPVDFVSDLRNILVQDLTGDGLADIAVIDNSSDVARLVLRVNVGGKSWSAPYEKGELPRHRPNAA